MTMQKQNYPVSLNRIDGDFLLYKPLTMLHKFDEDDVSLNYEPPNVMDDFDEFNKLMDESQKEQDKTERFRFWLPTTIAIVALVISIISLLFQIFTT